jgi:hypothetical protein
MSSIQKTPKTNTPTSSKPHVMILEREIGSHAHNVARSAQQVLPEANSVGISFRQVSEPKETLQYNRIPIAIENSFIGEFRRFAENLNDIGKLEKSQRPSAVNASWGTTKFSVLTSFQRQPELCYKMATEQERRSLFDLPKDEKATKYTWKLPELESYIDKTVDNSTNIAEEKQKAEDAVEELKKKDIAVVVSAANLNDDIEAFKKEHPDVQLEPDEGQIIFAPLKNVVTVGSSNADGTLTDYSSRGAEVDFTTQVPPSIKKRGTSFTAPVGAGMIAFLINQGMTVNEAIAYLKRLGKAKKDDTPEGNTYVDLNLEEVKKHFAEMKKPTSK